MQSNVTLTSQDVCLSMVSLNDNVVRSIDRHRCIKPVGLIFPLREVSGKCQYLELCRTRGLLRHFY